MDGQYPWRRAEETEIDLTDFLKKFCRQWKRITICALACAFLLGMAGWLRGRNGPDAGSREQEYAESEEIELTEPEQQAVEDAMRLEREIIGLETYLENSVLMQLDPYHKNKVIMLYWIDRAERQELPVITESYLHFVLNGGAADALLKSGSWKLDKGCLAELISAYQKTNSLSYQIVSDSSSDSSTVPGSFFYVEITGRNAKTAENMAQDMQNLLEKYSESAQKNAGSHRLTLIDCTKNVTADSSLQSQQHDKKALLSSSKTSLISMINGFSVNQKQAYYAAGGIKNEDKEELENEAGTDSYRRIIKYMFLGLAGGIFAYGGIFFCWYFFSGQIKSPEEMKRLYTMPVYGKLVPENRNQEKARMLNQIRIGCRRRGIKKLYAASDFMLGVKERECLESIAVQLREWDIDMEAAENAIADASLWDEIPEAAGVLMVCRLGLTTRNMIDDGMNFYLENDIAVIGSVVFSANI